MSRDSIGWYLTQIGRYPLLTPSQEISLAKQVQAGKEPAAARARRKLFVCNLRFVVNVAKRYARGVKSLQLEDLIQHGNLGLHKAVDRFDPERGYKFSTYSRHWIVQAILSGISEEEHAIRLPRDKRADVYRVRRAAGKLIQQLGRTPTMEEVAKAAEVPVTTCELAAGISNHPTSLDVELPGSGTLMDLIESPGGTDDDEEDREWPVRLVPTLPERERMVVERYYGLMGYHQTPMTQIAADMGVSRTMISLIRDRALNRLRMNYARMLSA